MSVKKVSIIYKIFIRFYDTKFYYMVKYNKYIYKYKFEGYEQRIDLCYGYGNNYLVLYLDTYYDIIKMSVEKKYTNMGYITKYNKLHMYRNNLFWEIDNKKDIGNINKIHKKLILKIK
mgnify:FL=1